MGRPLHPLAVCLLLVAAGCLGVPGAPSASSPSSPTTSAPSSPSTSTTSAQSAGERAVAAEQSRVEGVADGHENLTGLAVGVLDPAEYEVVRRNASGVVVRVDVGYSVSVDCDGDGEPDSAVDGANTEATYLVTEERVRLLAVSQDFLDPARYC